MLMTSRAADSAAKLMTRDEARRVARPTSPNYPSY
jgi:hypothetical protein